MHHPALLPWLFLALLWALPAPALDASAWQEVVPGGPTRCGPGQPFRFFARPGRVDTAVLFLQGGGACWSSDTCRLAGAPTYDPTAERSDLEENLEGLLALANPENPIRHATILFVPYCTGDAHLGEATRTYHWRGEDGTLDRFETHHAGRANVQAALDWLAERIPSPHLALVSGESAGGAAAGFYAGVLADRYPEARVVHLADSSAGLRARAVADLLDTWGASDVIRRRAGYREAEPLDFESFYRVEAPRHPRITWAQVNRVDDAIQAYFVGLAGRNTSSTRALIAEGRARIRSAVPSLATYDAEGSGHTLLTSPAFYSETAQGVRLRDWVAALLAGRAQEAVRCADCALGGG